MIQKQKYIVFGTGTLLKSFKEAYSDLEVAFYLDNNENLTDKKIDNIIIKHPNNCSLEELKQNKILIASSFYTEISMQLKQIGLVEDRDFLNWVNLMPIQYKRSYYKLDEDMEDEFVELYEKCYKYTLTSPARMYSLYQSVKYIVEEKIEGDIVECGVWKGGSMMMIAYTLQLLNDTTRKLYLYDTFEGMPEPSEVDVDVKGNYAKDILDTVGRGAWDCSPIEEVTSNISLTGYPEQNINYIKGLVEDTIPDILPTKISLLRLDTDFYTSTYHELTHMYPNINQKGILIIDDYGHWEGAGLATRQYFEENKINILLHKIDYTGRIAMKL